MTENKERRGDGGTACCLPVQVVEGVVVGEGEALAVGVGEPNVRKRGGNPEGGQRKTKYRKHQFSLYKRKRAEEAPSGAS